MPKGLRRDTVQGSWGCFPGVTLLMGYGSTGRGRRETCMWGTRRDAEKVAGSMGYRSGGGGGLKNYWSLNARRRILEREVEICFSWALILKGHNYRIQVSPTLLVSYLGIIFSKSFSSSECLPLYSFNTNGISCGAFKRNIAKECPEVVIELLSQVYLTLSSLFYSWKKLHTHTETHAHTHQDICLVTKGQNTGNGGCWKFWTVVLLAHCWFWCRLGRMA